MNQPLERIEIDFRFSDIPLDQLMCVAQKRNRKRGVLRLIALITWPVLVFGFLGLLRFIDGDATNSKKIIGIAFVAGTGATLLSLLLLNRPSYLRMLQAMKDAPSRIAGTRAVLDPKGLTFLGTGSRNFLSWRSVTDVIVAHDTTLIMPSSAEFYAIPHIGLPSSLSPEAFAVQIEAWRKAAAKNPWPDPPPFSSTVLQSLPTRKDPPSFF